MDERSYLQVARVLNKYRLWTSWCSTFLTQTGFELLGMTHLDHSLRGAGWQGTGLTVYHDVAVGSGFGYGSVLIDEAQPEEYTQNWLKAAQQHLHEHHMSFVTEGHATLCIAPVPAPSIFS